MCGSAAICVIRLANRTWQKKRRGPNFCAQPRRHTYLARYMRGKGKKKRSENDQVVPTQKSSPEATRVIRPSRCFHVASLGRLTPSKRLALWVARRGSRNAPAHDPSCPEQCPGWWYPGSARARLERSRQPLRAGGRGFVPRPVLRIARVIPRGRAAAGRRTRSSTAPGSRRMASAEKRSLSLGPFDRPAFRAGFAGGRQAAQPARATWPPKSRRPRRVPMWAVDCWPMATFHTRHSGASRDQ